LAASGAAGWARFFKGLELVGRQDLGQLCLCVGFEIGHLLLLIIGEIELFLGEARDEMEAAGAASLSTAGATAAGAAILTTATLARGRGIACGRIIGTNHQGSCAGEQAEREQGHR
jgi:hypothetical protein